MEAFRDTLLAFLHKDFHHESEFIDTDFENRPILVRERANLPAKYGDDWSRVVITIEDVTDQRRAETALRESEARYREIFHESPAAIWVEDWSAIKVRVDRLRISGVTDWSGYLEKNPDELREFHKSAEVLEVSQAVVDIFDAPSVEELIEDAQVSWRNPDELGAFRDQLLAFIAERDFVNVEFIEEKFDDSKIVVHEQGFIPSKYRADWSRVLFVLDDVTEQRKAEEALRQSQKMEAVGQLTGGMAHDFNNLLSIVLGNAELLAQALAGEEKLQSRTHAILSAANRGAELIEFLLAFSRRRALQPRATDLNDLVVGMTEMLRHTLGAPIKIETRRGNDIAAALIDPSQLQSALLNLAINARDAMPHGGSLTIETEEIDVKLVDSLASGVPPGRYVALSVSDDGTGMTPDIADRAFEPFFTTKETGQGTGLGLSMIYGFVRQSGGDVTITSEPRHGTTVALYLPVSAALAPVQKVKLPGPISLGQGETILFVENDDNLRSVTGEMLESLNYTVIEAANGDAALEVLVGEQRVDLMLTDVILPGLGGNELALGARHLRPAMPVIFMTGYAAQDPTIGLADEAGHVPPVLGKPVRRADLARALRDSLGVTAPATAGDELTAG